MLSPDDYGLVAMVVTVTSFLGVFSDLGLSYVTVQRPKISQDQLSALFWANVAFGVLLGTMTALLAPAPDGSTTNRGCWRRRWCWR